MSDEISFGWLNDKNDESHSYLIPSVQNILKQNKVNSLLDIGAGNGSALPHWLSLGLKVSAMEPDSDGYEYAKRNLQVDVRKLAVGDILPLEWKKSFDAIVCLEVIEHLYNPSQLMESIHYTLKDQGIAIISTPYHGYLKNLAMAFAGKWDFHHHPIKNGGHIKFWSKQTIQVFFRQNGFELVSFHGVGRVPYLWKSMILVFKKGNAGQTPLI